MFQPVARWLEGWPTSPDHRRLQHLAEAHPLYNDNGQRIRFEPMPDDGMAYEMRLWESGRVATRPNNWHDFFNGLVWLTFPASKRAINSSHRLAMQPDGEVRGKVRDALTHFDECGIVVVSSVPALLNLLRDFQWKALFVEQREAVIANMRFFIVGHATYEQLLQPFRGLTAKAVLYDVDADWLAQPLAAQIAAVDQRLAVDLASGKYQRPRDFQPLPVLGIPGVTPENASPAYYDDTWQFRPGRRGVSQAAVATA